MIIDLFSFSYKCGVPISDTHGGGFVFDCRCLPNPGREQRFAQLDGRDREVQQYLEQYPEVETFLSAASALVMQAVKNYEQRRFDALLVAFGCTGGRHRSVYCAERLAALLRSSTGAEVRLIHRDCGKADKR